MMRLLMLLVLLTVSECGGSRVVGRLGGSVTLSCKYNIKYYGALEVCWGRGQIPSSGCNQQLVSTDGHKVRKGTRVSSRYQLLGQLDAGDVSLTILNISETDAGRYGCRVEIPGLFNDDIHHFDLIVETALQTTATTLQRETSTEQTDSDTTGQVTSTDRLLTSSSSSITAEDSSSVNVVLLCVLFGLLALLTAGTVVIIAIRTRRLNKMPQQQVISSVQFSSTASNLQLHSRASAVENIYQIDGGFDEDEYDYCP